MAEGMGMASAGGVIEYEADVRVFEDLPRHLRTCAAMHDEVTLILPALVALHLARRIEAGRPVRPVTVPAPDPVPFEWIDRTRGRGEAMRAAVMLTPVLVLVVVLPLLAVAQ